MKLKQTLYVIALLIGASSMFGQDCPTEIQSQSTSTTIKFIISPGSCGTFPTTILIDDSGNTSTFDLDKCNGSNLDYTFTSGTEPTDPLTLTADFGGGVVCTYVNGALVVLGLDDLEIAKHNVQLKFVNASSEKTLVLRSDKNIKGQVVVYDIKGSEIFNETIRNTNLYHINTSHWSRGAYIAKFISDQKVVIKKFAF